MDLQNLHNLHNMGGKFPVDEKNRYTKYTEYTFFHQYDLRKPLCLLEASQYEFSQQKPAIRFAKLTHEIVPKKTGKQGVLQQNKGSIKPTKPTEPTKFSQFISVNSIFRTLQN